MYCNSARRGGVLILAALQEHLQANGHRDTNANGIQSHMCVVTSCQWSIALRWAGPANSQLLMVGLVKGSLVVLFLQRSALCVKYSWHSHVTRSFRLSIFHTCGTCLSESISTMCLVSERQHLFLHGPARHARRARGA